MLSTNAYAITGNELLDQLSSTNVANNSRGISFVAGVVDGYELGYAVGRSSSGGPLIETPETLRIWTYCLPGTATYGQIADIVNKYLRDAPEERHVSAQISIRHALRKAFPCISK